MSVHKKPFVFEVGLLLDDRGLSKIFKADPKLPENIQEQPKFFKDNRREKSLHKDMGGGGILDCNILSSTIPHFFTTGKRHLEYPAFPRASSPKSVKVT